MNKSDRSKLKSIAKYKELDERKKRLVNKLIQSLHDETIQLESDTWFAINRQLNQARRPVGVDTARKYANGYTLWYRKECPAFRKENKDMTIQEVGRTLGKKWRTLPESERVSWKQKAKDLRKT